MLDKLKEKAQSFFFNRISSSEQKSWRLVFGLIKEHKVFLFVLMVFGIVIGLVEGISIALIAYSVTIVVGESSECHPLLQQATDIFYVDACQPFDKYFLFVFLIVISMVVQVIKGVLSYLSNTLGVFFRTKVTFQMRQRVTSHIFSLDYKQLSAFSVGEKNILNAKSTALASLVPLINTLIVTLCVLSAYFLIMLKMNIKLTVFSFIVLGALLLFVSPVLKKVKHISVFQKWTAIKISKEVLDYLVSIRLVKLYARESEVNSQIEAILRKEVGLARRSGMFSNLLQPLQETLVIFSVAGVLLAAFYFYSDDIEVFLPSALAFVLVLHKASTRVAGLNDVRAKFARAMANVGYVSDFLDIEPINKTRGNKKIGHFSDKLEMRDLSFSYDDKKILDNLSFSISKGQKIAFVGSSGAGKSTIVDVMTGLFLPSSGSVLIDGVKSVDTSSASWASQFSMVSQNDLILNSSVYENLRFAKPDATKEEIRNACITADAHEFISSMEDGYDSILGDLGQRVSGGQIQRIAFARAILKGAPILILDEATSALDSITEARIINAIKQMDREKTIILIAHRLSTIVDVDLIYVLSAGEIVASGTHTELLENSDMYAEMWKIQTHLSN